MIIYLQNYSNEVSCLDLVKYGLRLWGMEIVKEVFTCGTTNSASTKYRLPPAYNNEASRSRLPSYIGFDGAMVSIQGCDPCDESSILSRSPHLTKDWKC